MVRVLLEGGADVNADGGQAHHNSIWEEEWSIVYCLVNKGASILQSDISHDYLI